MAGVTPKRIPAHVFNSPPHCKTFNGCPLHLPPPPAGCAASRPLFAGGGGGAGGGDQNEDSVNRSFLPWIPSHDPKGLLLPSESFEKNSPQYQGAGCLLNNSMLPPSAEWMDILSPSRKKKETVPCSTAKPACSWLLRASSQAIRVDMIAPKVILFPSWL